MLSKPNLKNDFDAIQYENKSEFGQARSRLLNVFIVISYIYLSDAIDNMNANNASVLFAYVIFFIFISLCVFFHVRRYPGNYPLRRIATMIADYGSLAFAMSVIGQTAMPFYALIPWITLGNGLRFGQRYLLIAAIMAQLCLAAIYIWSPYWQQQTLLMITFSITTLALPIYALLLLRQTADARDAALNAMQSKSRFLAQASHDLRQPVHAVSYYIAALRESRLNRSQIQLVDRIERSLGGTARLFKSLLDISKLDSDTFEVEFETVELQPLLAGLIEQNEQFVAWHRVKFRLVPTTVSVRADATLLTTMIQNLLSNAIKYGRGSSVLLGVRRRGDTVSIEIHDQGIGIDAKHLPRIFDEFYRGHVAGDYDSEGVGLGLSIVKRLASLCGLSIALDSVRGQGTTVRLSNIPRATDFVPVSSAPTTETPQPLSGLRVILIEDDPDVLDATTRILERWGCSVAPHSKMLAEYPKADLVIADFDLGNGATGTDAIKAIRANLGRQVPAILMTGHPEEIVRSQIQSHDISLLTKPVQPATLRSLLSAIRIRLLDQT